MSIMANLQQGFKGDNPYTSDHFQFQLLNKGINH